MERLLLKAEEVASVLGVGRSKVYQLAGTGDLPVVRVGRSMRFPADALRRWVEEQTGESFPARKAPGE